MKKEIANPFKDLNFQPYFYYPLLAGLLLNGLCWLVLLWRIPQAGEWVPLHYHVFFGINWFGPWLYIFVYPLSAFLFLAANSIIAYFLQNKENFIVRLLVWLGLICQIFTLLYIFALIIFYFS